MAVDHVIVLVLENRSFDHMLGFLDHSDPEFDGLLRGGPRSNPGYRGAPPVAATPTALPVIPIGPDHSHDGVMEQLAVEGRGAGRHAANLGFVTNLERTGRGLRAAAYGGLLGPLRNLGTRLLHRSPSTPGRGPLAMRCQPEANVPVLTRLALDFAVCTRWFCSVPGETWPNRNFLHAATSDGETNIALRFYTDPTIFELLESCGKDWRIYHDDTPQVWAFPNLWDTPARHARWYPPADFARHIAQGTLPAYSFIEPNHRPAVHVLDDGQDGPPGLSDNQHPENNIVDDATYASFAGGPTDFSRGEALVATVYEALRANPAVFARSVLLITYDEHGGFYDHVPPPTGVPSPGTRPKWGTRLLRLLLHRRAAAFDFRMLGPRVPAVVVSPLVAAGTVDTIVHDHASVPATLRAVFAPDAAPLTPRDGWAQPFHGLLTLAQPRDDLPDLSAFATPAAASTASAAPPPSPAAAPPPSPPAGPTPPFYRHFADQAELVYNRLASVGEPEAAAVGAGSREQRAADISRMFGEAAARHRATPAGG